jgi:hypothetical protein
MSGSDTQLSRSLQALVDGFLPLQGEPDGVSIDQDELQKMVAMLQVMQALATNLELEVRCLRDMEAGRGARDFLDEEASAHLSDLLPEVDGNIVRPDFRNGGRS